MGSSETTPRHVAIIMDGNGRWATKRSWTRIKGHVEGGNRAFEVIEEAHTMGIQYLTLFCFSTENWKRPKKEVSFLMDLMRDYLLKKLSRLKELNVRIKTMGQIHRAPESHRKVIERSEKETAQNTGMTLHICLSYGGRQEILDATQSIAQKCCEGKIQLEDINEELFSQHLYAPSTPDPDLVIRTSGEQRISNFLLWQIAYSELYLTQTLWPDFSREEFRHACLNFSSRERRFGRAQALPNTTP